MLFFCQTLIKNSVHITRLHNKRKNIFFHLTFTKLGAGFFPIGMNRLVVLFLSAFNNKVQYTSQASLINKRKNTGCDLTFPNGFVVAGGGFLSYWYQQLIKLINLTILIFLIPGVSGYDRKEIYPRPPLINLQKVRSQHVFSFFC